MDWMRVIACFMVMLVHSTEPFYLGGDDAFIASSSDALWVSFFDSLARCCVPLFVIASSYLQFPVRYSTGEFFRRRAARILIPFAVWSVFYAFYWGEPVTNLKGLLLNFNYAAGHLWFVYMIVGIYILMPLLSPWAEKVGKKELTAYLSIWFLASFIPLLRDWASDGTPLIVFGPTGVPRQALFPLWGEACWNSFGTFYYVSGFAGYLLLGLWFRKFGDGISLRKSLAVGIPCYLAGFVITAGGFLRRAYASAGGVFPFAGNTSDSTWWETTWDFCSAGVVLMTVGLVLLMKNIRSDGRFYGRIVFPVSGAGYGMYLGHMVALSFFAGLYGRILVSTPVVILATAVSSYVTVAAAAVLIRKIPVAGKMIAG